MHICVPVHAKRNVPECAPGRPRVGGAPSRPSARVPRTHRAPRRAAASTDGRPGFIGRRSQPADQHADARTASSPPPQAWWTTGSRPPALSPLRSGLVVIGGGGTSWRNRVHRQAHGYRSLARPSTGDKRHAAHNATLRDRDRTPPPKLSTGGEDAPRGSTPMCQAPRP
jgi:hypothetical protein